MRIRMLPLVLVASLAAGSAALAAASTATGTIKSIDTAKMEITLSDGTVYMLPKGFKVADLKVGEKVSVTWDMANGAHAASAVAPAS